VKPENVMVREDGVVKVLDFGIARSAPLLSEGGATSTRAPGAPILPTLTERGLSVGTPLYMAPEQLRGDPLDPRSDQFAWGVVVYELLTGASPWASDAGPLQAVSNILTRIPPPMRTVNRAVPAEVDELVRRALSKDAGDRFASMDDVVRALEPHAGVALGRGAARMPHQRVKRRRRTVVVALTALVAAGAATQFVMRHRSVASGDDRPSTLAVSDAGPRAMLTERGARDSANPRAAAEYRAGMQALHDAGLGPARARLRRAIEADPSFAAANLGLVLATWELSDEVRSAFRRGLAYRADLGPTDAELLLCFEPLMRVPSDSEGTQKLLAAYAHRHPQDTEGPLQLAKVRTLSLEYKAALTPLDAALHAVPDQPMALALRGIAYAYLDRIDEAVRDFDRCNEVSPAATLCLAEVIQLQANEGRCSAVEGAARRMISVEPDGSHGYDHLSSVLYALNRPRDAVLLAQAQSAARAHVPELAKVNYRYQLAAAEGRFEEALASIAEWERLLRDDQVESFHATLMKMHGTLLLEIGRDKEAAALAREYSRKHAGWTPDPEETDPIITAHAIRYRAGDLTRSAYLRLRDDWLAAEWKRLSLDSHPEARSYLWFEAYGDALRVREDGEEAALALTRFSPLPYALERDVTMERKVGAAYLRAGVAKDALPSLRRAAASCLSLEEPVEYLQAVGLLGDALRELGDRSGACDAYTRVLHSWESARPASVTAEHARIATRALRCSAVEHLGP
jgi:tetratricopeptide (TPR) repeat protein